MRKLFLVIISFLSLSSFAQEDTLKFRITLKDKAATTYSLKKPHAYLSEKALERRMRQQIAIDSTDLPVCKSYLADIRTVGVNIVAAGKWENFVTVSCNDTTLIDEISEFPFVSKIEKVWKGNPANKKNKRDSIYGTTVELDNHYGASYQQLSLSNGDKLHEAGFKGNGITIAVIDAGFHNADRIPLMQNINILGTRDFVNPRGNVYDEDDHGLKVFSCMAMNQPHIMIGSAPEASYWLLRSEDASSEYPVEEDYWAAAAEFADSVGVDIINTSLGYYIFNDVSRNYRYRDLTGKISLMSRQAGHLANKGIVMVCSAGNTGLESWKKITPPSDAENVLTVGAVTKRGVLANFSSVGNTADNRIKPDVVAVGMFADIMNTNGEPGVANGTSFAAPVMCGMVACLWQARPELTAKQVIELVRQSGDRADFPDNIYGYGVPDMWKASQMEINE